MKHATKKKPPVSRKASSGADQQAILIGLTKRWQVTLGKSAESIIETAAILSDAKAKITDREAYVGWLKSVCKMSEATASKYQQIHTRRSWLAEARKQLPPTWTMWYLLTQCKTKPQFLKAVAFVVANAPSYKELDDCIHTLLNKKPKKTLFRADKLVTNSRQITAKVKEITAQAKQEAAEAKQEAAKLKAQLKLVKSEPTKAQIEEMETFDWDDDSNIVKFEQFAAAYKKLQREKLERKIKAMLHAEGLNNVTVILRQMADARKAAA
jgi:hypothetical protein